MLGIKSMYFLKKTESEGSFVIELADHIHEEQILRINNIKLDLNNSIEPISYYKLEGNPLLNGTYFDFLKRLLMKVFAKYIKGSVPFGLYKWNSDSGEVDKV